MEEEALKNKKKKLKKVKGKVAAGSTATKLECKVHKVDSKTGAVTESTRKIVS